MEQRYGSGLIGLDVKPRRSCRIRRNRQRIRNSRWLLPVAVVIAFGLLFLAGVR